MSRDFFILEAVISKLTCPCGAVNYVLEDDFEDLSKLDPATVECWKCGKVYWIAEITKNMKQLIDRREPELPEDFSDLEGHDRPPVGRF